MTRKNWFTVALTGVLTAAPQFIAFIPPPYGAAASGAIALIGALYHLWQPTPA